MRLSARSQLRGPIIEVAKDQTTSHIPSEIGAGRPMRALGLSLQAAALAALAVMAVLVSTSTVMAQDASGCAKFKWSIDRERSAFGTPGLQSVDPGKPLPGIMDPAIVKLQPVSSAAFEQPPGHKPKDGTFGAVLKSPPIAVAGTYQITLSDQAWIDVIQGGKKVRSSAFSDQSDCPNVRKSVRFPLAVGQATLQISGSATDSIKVDVLPAQ